MKKYMASGCIAIFLDYIIKTQFTFRFYEGAQPTITVGDVNILRQILIKDFHKFVDRRVKHT